MKISTGVLSFLILAAALGSQARVIHDKEATELMIPSLQHEPPIINEGFHRPADCCLSYTPRSIRCFFMTDYFETSSGCSQPGVIFLTRKGQRVCANPSNVGVQECMKNLKLDPVT
ncbi:C-C motif chemokine 15-like [Carlito syrichta]|uniref:C-C motif chemokine n=1 Tax=Carlito syrichta TaxID=1868482 RepID=A0A1U7U3L8_CARSF|nr:C-C motif chemokine 15-like [Carlito syrichta]